jgi:hypothetical protein
MSLPPITGGIRRPSNSSPAASDIFASATAAHTHQLEVLTNPDLLAEILAFFPSVKDCHCALLANHSWSEALKRYEYFNAPYYLY